MNEIQHVLLVLFVELFHEGQNHGQSVIMVEQRIACKGAIIKAVFVLSKFLFIDREGLLPLGLVLI